ncbi:MAG: oligosaccharide flippase family protein [Ignavibacteria bacterium]
MKLIINFVSKLGVDSIARMIGFLTLPVITRALGPDGYGQYTYLFVILSYFGFFIDFGYLNYGTNKLCEKIDSNIVIGKIISLQLLTLIFSYIVLFIAGYFIFDFDKYIYLLIFSFTYITQIFAIKYYYLANNKLYYNSLSELAGQLVYAGLIFFVFVNYPGVLSLIIFSAMQTFVTAIFLFTPYIKKHRIKIDLNIKTNLQTLKEAYKLGLAAKAEGITSSFILLSIGIFLNEESVGLYNASNKIYLILLTIVQSMSYALMPVLLNSIKDKQKIKKIGLIFYSYIIAGLFLFTITYFFSDKIILILFGEKFINSIPLLNCFSITILIWPVVMFLGLIILAFNKYNYILLISITSVILSVVFSLLLINVFGIIGAGLVLPVVAIGTIGMSVWLLRRITVNENLDLADFFSIKNAFRELKEILNRKHSI